MEAFGKINLSLTFMKPRFKCSDLTVTYLAKIASPLNHRDFL